MDDVFGPDSDDSDGLESNPDMIDDDILRSVDAFSSDEEGDDKNG